MSINLDNSNKLDSDLDRIEPSINSTNETKICKHICEKKKRRCKFTVLKNSDYCLEHLAFNKEQVKQAL